MIVVGDRPAAAAVNLTRDLFQSVPGLTVWEFNGTGIQANVAARGLSPHRSSEFNVRQNGYDISSDPYGYPEAHYTPPTLALERINVIRGGGGIQYGTQMGGMLDYVLVQPGPERLQGRWATTLGMFGLVDVFGMVHGTLDTGVTYRSWLTHRRADGWRQNGSYDAGSAHIGMMFPLAGGRLGIEVTGLWFTERMPNGLTQDQYDADSRSSFRPRDWFAGPRIMPAVMYTVDVSPTLTWATHVSGLLGDRNSISLTTSTAVADSGTNPRRVNLDAFANVLAESRLAWSASSDLRVIGGMRGGVTQTIRKQGRGPDGTDYTTAIVDTATIDLDLRSNVMAAFAEAEWRAGQDITLTGGARVEVINSTADGFYGPQQPHTSPDAWRPAGPRTALNSSSTAVVPLFSAGIEYALTPFRKVFFNASQSYRPLFYAQQFPYDGIRVDPSITPSRGLLFEGGYVGPLVTAEDGSNIVEGALTVYSLLYADRVGVLRDANGERVRTNAGSSIHRGTELSFHASLVQRNDVAIAIRGSASFLVARYTSGPAEGKRVEFAPASTIRPALLVRVGPVMASVGLSYMSGVFSDAANTQVDPSGQFGWVDASALLDASLEVHLGGGMRVSASIMNAADVRYHTLRATVYPGPGILPGDGRTAMLTLRQDW